MTGKEGQSIPSTVTISPMVQELSGSEDGISMQTLVKLVPLPRPTRENVLRRLSEALMRRSLTMVRFFQDLIHSTLCVHHVSSHTYRGFISS